MKLASALFALLLLAPVAAQAQTVPRATNAAPTYEEGSNRPLSVTLQGALRVTNVSTGTSAQQVQGTSASAATDSGNPVKVGCVYNAAVPTVTTGQRVDCQADPSGSQRVLIGPSTAATSGIVPSATAAVGGSLIVKASAGNLYDWQVTSGASAGYVLILNSATVPADGAVTPLQCVAVAANSTVGSSSDTVPDRYSAGITIVFSTTGCFTKTISATAFIRGRGV